MKNKCLVFSVALTLAGVAPIAFPINVKSLETEAAAHLARAFPE